MHFLKDFIYLFLERREWREKERKRKHQCVVASHASPTGDLARNPGMCRGWESNWQPLGLQACAQSTELHQPGQKPEETFKSLFYHLIPTLIQFLFVSEMVHR